jgi:Ser/Thr protein kinase RdoA (MazF antagonist)
MALDPPSAASVARALAEFPALRRPGVAPLSGGLINQSFAVTAEDGEYVLQRVHPVFAPEVHENIAAVTERLRERGEASPRLLVSRGGRPWVELGAEGVWRVMTRLPGLSFDQVQGPEQARAAGALVGRFHTALEDLDHSFKAVRAGVHDTPAHLRTLTQALAEHGEHRLFPEVAELAAQVFAGYAALPPPGEVPLRVCHGDLKFNNLLFSGTGPEEQVVTTGIIDLDTVGRMPLHHELGDAWRSWCNRGGEDQRAASFDLEVFTASLEGYLAAITISLTPEERRALVHGVEWISLELAARFAADALREAYFGWDRARFPAAGEHNLLRAQGQWAMHRAALQTRDARAALLQVDAGR